MSYQASAEDRDNSIHAKQKESNNGGKVKSKVALFRGVKWWLRNSRDGPFIATSLCTKITS